MSQKKTIGIVSPSAPISAFCPKRLARGVEELEALGFKIKLGKHVSEQTGFTAGSVRDRVSDIQDMFTDDEVDIIVATIGGYNANDLLDSLDYSLISKHSDKIFVGYSDITILLTTLQEKANVHCILGPMILPQFAEFGGTLPFTKKSFLEILEMFDGGGSYPLPVAKSWTEEFTPWDVEDNRERVKQENEGWKVVQAGSGQGRLVGGNLRTLLVTAGTKYFPNFRDCILFLEDDDEENAATLCRMLTQMRQLGVLEIVNGIVFGRFQKKSEISVDALRNVCELVGLSKDIPVIMGVDFGHTDPMLSLPINKKVSIETDKPSIVIDF